MTYVDIGYVKYSTITLKIALGAQIADGQPEYGQPVQLG